MNIQKTRSTKRFQLAGALSLIIAMVVAPMTAQAGGVPVFDGANVAQAISQVNNQVKQIENMRNQLKSVTGNARIGVLLNDPTVASALAKYTPKGVSLADLADGNYDKALQTIVNRMQNDIKNGAKPKDPKVALAQAELMNMASVERSMNTLTALTNRTQSIANQINATTDVSSKADLANTLQANNSQIQIAIAQANLQLRQMEMLEKQAQKVADKASADFFMGRK